MTECFTYLMTGPHHCDNDMLSYKHMENSAYKHISQMVIKGIRQHEEHLQGRLWKNLFFHFKM